MTLAEELFNILKGANLKLRLFDTNGQKTVEQDEAARMYVYEEDMLLTIRATDDDSIEVVIQLGVDFQYDKHKKMLKQIKQVAHNHMSEYNIRKFSNKITPKDFANDSVVAEGYSKAHGSIKTSYITLPEARIVIKHSKGVNEEVRGSRSRNIKALYIENNAGDRFAFPHRYLQGAKAMAKHVNMGGTPTDAIGESILSTCKEILECNQFLKHIRVNKLVNEGNANVVEFVKSKLKEMKHSIRSLQTSRGYANCEARSEVSNDNQVDIAQQFMYNTFETANMDTVLSTVSRIVSERKSIESMHKELLANIYELISSGNDLKLTIDANDPEHPDNEDQSKYSGQHGAMAKLSAMISFLGKSTQNDELFNHLAQLSQDVHDLPQQQLSVAVKLVMYLIKNSTKVNKAADTVGENIAESATILLRRKIS